MDTETSLKAPWAVRCVLVSLLLSSCLLLGVWLLPAGARHPLLPAVCLVAMVLAIDSWLMCSIRTSLGLSAVVVLVTIWAWAVSRAGWLGWLLVAGIAVMAAAAFRKRQELARLLSALQQVEALREETAVVSDAMGKSKDAVDALQKKQARYAQLQAVAESFSSRTRLEDVCQASVKHAFGLIGKSEACLLLLVDADRQGLSLIASQRRPGLAPVRAKHGDHFDQHVLRSRIPLLVDDVRRDFRFPAAAPTERTVASVIACPLVVGERVSGVLRLDSSRPNAYAQDELRLLDIVADLTATAVENAALFARTQQLAVTDGLTGLMLRRPLLEQLGSELVRSARSEEPVSVALLDIDHFKRYNDAFGHTAGDFILKSLAGLLRAAVPRGLPVGRYGGEEFVVVLPRYAKARAAELAEQIRAMVEGHTQWSGRGLPPGEGVTVSLGVATAPDDGMSAQELIRLADARLYRAKHEGRNRVCSC